MSPNDDIVTITPVASVHSIQTVTFFSLMETSLGNYDIIHLLPLVHESNKVGLTTMGFILHWL